MMLCTLKILQTRATLIVLAHNAAHFNAHSTLLFTPHKRRLASSIAAELRVTGGPATSIGLGESAGGAAADSKIAVDDSMRGSFCAVVARQFLPRFHVGCPRH